MQMANFYKFIKIDNLKDLSESVKEFLKEYDIKGTVLLAEEGINCSLVGFDTQLDLAIVKLKKLFALENLDIRYSYANISPFKYLKVKIKKEIITFRQNNLNVFNKTGTKVDAQDWNKLIVDNETLVIDTRNDYEVEAGTFKNAINPQTKKFSDFVNFVEEKLNQNKHKKIAMFCTGGIRCEKASSYLLDKGFKEVYQLEGGILKYLEETSSKESLWQGVCFVFDERNKVF